MQLDIDLVLFFAVVEVFNYFRAIVQLQEFSERALDLTSHALRVNSLNYNVWNYRRKILRNIKFNVTKEICWSEMTIRENPKNFYAWEHRRAISATNMGCFDGETELKFSEAVLEENAKNYSAWNHRQWAIKTFKYSNSGLTTSEMIFTEKMLECDLRNNSAWNQRFFVLKLRGKIDFAIVKKEFLFVTEKIKIAFDNESSWNYLLGILEIFKNVQKLPELEEFMKFLEMEYAEKKNQNRHLIAFLIDRKIDMILTKFESSEIIHTQKVRELCTLMADKVDKTRRNYWKFIYKKFYFDKIQGRKNDDSIGGAKVNQSWKENIGKKMDSEKETSFESLLEKPPNDQQHVKKNLEMKKGIKCQVAPGIGTDLLFELMNKYNC